MKLTGFLPFDAELAAESNYEITNTISLSNSIHPQLGDSAACEGEVASYGSSIGKATRGPRVVIMPTTKKAQKTFAS